MPQNTIPVSYTLPYTVRPARKALVLKFVLFMAPIAMIAFALAYSPPGNEIDKYTIILGFVALVIPIWLVMTTLEFQLSEDRLSYRIWFLKKEIEYSSISKISFCQKYISGGKAGMYKPYMEIQGNNGESLSISLHLFLNNETDIWVLHDVLKRKAPLAMMDLSFEKLFPELGDPVNN